MNTTKRNTRSITKILGNYSFVLIFACILIAYLIINAGATTLNGVMNILRHSAVVGIMAFGMGLVIITGGIDLSVGSMLSLIGGIGVVVFNAKNSIFLTLLAVLAVGALLGFFNGILIGKVKMPPFIVTLATMLIYRSVAQYYLRTLRLSIYNMDGTLSAYDPFYKFGQYKVAGLIPMAGVILILVTVLMVFMSTNTKFGRSIYAIGSNERAARLAGINSFRVKMAAYIMTSMFASMAGIILAGRMNSGNPAASPNLHFDAITAANLGGVSMVGGVGSIPSVIMGVLLVQAFNSGLNMAQVSSYWQYVARGLLLFTSLAIDYYRQVSHQKRLLADTMKHM